MNTKEFQTATLVNALQSLPSGELIKWLQNQLKPEDFDKACGYILETILSQLVTVCAEATQTKLSQLLAKDDFEGFFQILGGLLDEKINPNAAVFKYTLMDSLQLGFEVVCAQHNLELDS